MELKLLLNATTLEWIDSVRGEYSRAGFIRHLLKDMANKNKNSSEKREDERESTK